MLPPTWQICNKKKNSDWKEGDHQKRFTLSTQILKQSFIAVLRNNCFWEKFILNSHAMFNNGQTYFKNPPVFTRQDFSNRFGHFSILAYLKLISIWDECTTEVWCANITIAKISNFYQHFSKNLNSYGTESILTLVQML